ncbi:MAG: membrane-bound ClpP family serine protease [Bacteroidia bacterium]|jgi:membrane-bound ClpP family serine protease
MTLGLIIFFIVIGLVFLLVEILVTPGVVLGIIGLGFIGFGVYQAYEMYGNTTGNIVLFSAGVVTVSVVLLALKSGVWTQIASTGTIAGKAKENAVDLVQVGDQGKALSAMRPLGTGLINSKKVEVSSEGEAIAATSLIEVIRIEQNKIFIKKINI